MTKDESTLFTRLLVAQHSPENSCHAQDGEVLIVKPNWSPNARGTTVG